MVSRSLLFHLVTQAGKKSAVFQQRSAELVPRKFWKFLGNKCVHDAQPNAQSHEHIVLCTGIPLHLQVHRAGNPCSGHAQRAATVFFDMLNTSALRDQLFAIKFRQLLWRHVRLLQLERTHGKHVALKPQITSDPHVVVDRIEIVLFLLGCSPPAMHQFFSRRCAVQLPNGKHSRGAAVQRHVWVNHLPKPLKENLCFNAFVPLADEDNRTPSKRWAKTQDACMMPDQGPHFVAIGYSIGFQASNLWKVS